MPHKQKASDAQLKNAYKRLKSVYAVGELFGMRGSSAHERLKKIGVVLSQPKWTTADDERLRREYVAHRTDGRVEKLAKEMGRTRQFLCRKARLLGITDSSAPRSYFRVWKGISEIEAVKHFNHFKRSSLGLGAYCKRFGYDDLGFSRAMKLHFADQWEGLLESKQPLQSLYRLGRSVEYAVRDELREHGYFALRSPRSAGPVDVIGFKKGIVLMCQCKRSMACSVREWNDIFNLAESVGAIPLLAGRPTGRGIVYKRMTGLKDGSKRRQPMCDYAVS